MRRLPVPLLAFVALACSLLVPAADAGAAPSERPERSHAAAVRLGHPVQPEVARAAIALGRSNGAGAGDVSGRSARRIDASLGLRDLFLARPTLGADDDRAAGRLLARPTGGDRDPYGDSHTTPPAKKCGPNICVHWVRSGTDAPPDDAWAATELDVMEQVWRHHIDSFGYRPPASDGRRGGNAKFDVYLTELGDYGLYGYCAPEDTVPGEPRQASGFCVLDNDFARSQFGRAPMDALRVTAAHEFFHAIQFAYDVREDPWLLESTATWMEERFADDVDDNRSYLPYGQVAKPSESLDLFDAGGFAHYGNWAFWEFLSERYGNAIVRQVIERAGTGGGLPNDDSIDAVRHVLAGKGGLAQVFAAYAAGNTHPASTYTEGKWFPKASPSEVVWMRADDDRATFTTSINHLASASMLLRPDKSLYDTGWRLRIRVDAPAAKTAPAAYLVATRTDGTSYERRIDLNGTGYGMTEVAFSRRSIASVSVTLANVSTRYRCNHRTSYSCAGVPRDQGLTFSVGAQAYRD